MSDYERGFAAGFTAGWKGRGESEVGANPLAAEATQMARVAELQRQIVGIMSTTGFTGSVCGVCGLYGVEPGGTVACGDADCPFRAPPTPT